MKKITWKQIYVKFMIKKPMVFYLFLLFSIAVFCAMASSFYLDIYVKYDGIIDDNKIVLDTKDTLNAKVAYIEMSNNDRVKTTIYNVEIDKTGLILYIPQNDSLTDVNGEMHKVDVVIGKRTLLEAVFQKLGGGE